MVWYGMVCYGMVLYGTRYGMVKCIMIPDMVRMMWYGVADAVCCSLYTRKRIIV